MEEANQSRRLRLVRRRIAVVAAVAVGIAVLVIVAYLWTQQERSTEGKAPPTSASTTRSEIERAYRHFWETWAKANLNLDHGSLQEVAIDPALQNLVSQIEAQKLENQPRRVRVDHDYRIIIARDADGEQTAYLEDRYVNHTVRINPESGEETEADPNELVRATFVLKRVGRLWKVAEIIERE